MRPYRFKLNTNHDLAQGLVFAGLGNVAGSGEYFDSSAIYNDGAINGQTWELAAGRRGLYFSGALGEYTEVPYRAEYRADSPMTWAAWYAQPATGINNFLFGKSLGTGTREYYAAVNSANRVILAYVGGSVQETDFDVISAGVLHHLAFVDDGTHTFDGMEIYIDGVPSARLTGGGVAPNVTDGPLWIGAYANPNSNVMNGNIWDFCVYNRALRLDEIAQLADPENYMLSGLIEKVPETKRFFFKEAPPQPTNLRLLYTPKKKYATRPYRFKLNDNHPLSEGLVFAGLGNVAGSDYYFDSSVERNDGTLIGTAEFKFDKILGRSAVKLDGINQYIRTSIVPNVNGSTVAAWFKRADISYRWEDVLIGTSNRYFDFTASVDGNGNVILRAGGVSASSIAPPPGTDSFHIAITFDGVDAVPFYNGDIATSNTIETAEFTGELGFGWAAWAEEFPGLVADCMYYSRILTPAEIAQFADPDNIMLSGLIEPLRDPPSYFFTQPTPTEAITGIFEPLVIGV